METSDILGLLPTLLGIIGDKAVGFDDKTRQKFDHALRKAMKPTVKDDDQYINNAERQIGDIIDLIIKIIDNPYSINTIILPNYITREELSRFYDQINKDKELWLALQIKWNQYINKEIDNTVKAIEEKVDHLNESSEDIKDGIYKVRDSVEDIKGLLKCDEEANKADSSQELYECLDKKLKNKRDNHPSFRLMDIEDDLLPDGMITFEFETEALDSENQLKRVKDIVEESWNKPDKNHLMIEGIGGIGKTVTLLSLPDKLAPHYVPAVYIPLHELKGETNTIEKYIKSQILDYNDNEARFGQLMDSVGKPWNKGPRLLMLLDGFNEIPNERRADISLDIEHWSERPGVQIITSSRYDIRQYVALSSSFSKIELQPLKEENVKAYLKKTGFDVPENPTVINLITTPLLLTLYIRTEKLRINRKSPLADFRETKNAGLLIWNYLQSELWRYRTQKEEAKACVLAMEFIAPYIAWTMQQHSDFVLNENDFLDRLDKAYDLLKAHFGNTTELPKHIKTTVKQTSGQLPEYAFIRDLLQEQLSLFNRQERKDANNNLLVEYRLMHQQFRDALAAMHLINSIYLNGDSLPMEWDSTVDYYVMQFVADLINEEEATRLWEQNRKTKPSDEHTIRNQLRLQGILHNNKFSHLNFSDLDLSNISLYPYNINNTTIKLPDQSEKMNETKFSEITFSPEGHTNGVYTLAITPDGKRLISGSYDYSIRIWDMETSAPTAKPLIGHDGWVNSVAVTPDGKLIVSGSEDKTIRVWDLEKGEQIGKPLIGHKKSVNAITITTDGARFVSGSEDKTIRIWDLEKGEQIGKPITGHNGPVNSVAVTPDCKRIVSSSQDKTIRIWNIDTGEQIGDPIIGHKDSVHAIVLTPDGRHIVSGSEDKTIRIWDLETGKQIGSPISGHEKSVNYIAITTDGTRILSGSDDKTIRIWNLETHKQIGNPFLGHEDCVNAIAINKNGNRVISGSDDRTIRIWNIVSGEQIGNSIQGYNYSVRALVITPDDKYIVSGLGDKTIRIWDLETRIPIGNPLRGHEDWVRAVTVSPNGKYIVSGSGDKTIRIWDLETCEQIGKPLTGHDGPVNSVAVTPDGKHIVSSSQDKTIRIWNIDTGEQIAPIIRHEESVQAIVVTPDGKHIVSGSDDKTIRIWDLETGEQIGKPFIGHENWVRTIAVTIDGKRIVSGSDDKTIRIWDMETHEQIGEPFEGHEKMIRGVTVTRNCKYVISGSGDKTVRIWDLYTGRQIGNPIEGHDSWVRVVAVTSDNKFVVSGSWYGTLCITNIETREVRTIRIHPLSFYGLDFSKAIISTPELKETLRQNGAKVDPD